MQVLFCWTGRSFSKSNRRFSAATTFFFVQPNDPRILCYRFMRAFRTHSSTRFVTVEFQSSVEFFKAADQVMAGLSKYFEGKLKMEDGSGVLIIPVLPFTFSFHNRNQPNYVSLLAGNIPGLPVHFDNPVNGQILDWDWRLILIHFVSFYSLAIPQ